MMDRLELQKLRDLPIEGVAERLGLRVMRHKALCPFHEDRHPSLSFCVRKNTYRCFVCGEHGGTIDLVMRYLHKDFKEACRWLADENNIILEEYRPAVKAEKQAEKLFDASRYARFFERPWLSVEAAHFLYEERRLDARVVRWCRLTSWQDKYGVNWLQTPYYDIGGRLVGVQNRNLDYRKPSAAGGGVKGAARFLFPSGSQCSMYNLQIVQRLKEGDELWIAEGCSDTWSLLSSGRKAIAIPSATLLSPKDKDFLSSLSSSLSLKWSMYPDNDVPGEQLFLQLKEILPDLQHHRLPDGCKDFSDYYVGLRMADGNA